MESIYCMKCHELIQEYTILDDSKAEFIKVKYSCPNCLYVIECTRLKSKAAGVKTKAE